MHQVTPQPTSAPAPRRERAIKLNSIQYLRAVAAFMVVFAHASTSLLDKNRAILHFEWGGKGVDLFFVISGFIMFYTTDGKQLSPGSFYRKRLIRIAPLYFLISTAGFLLAYLLPHAFATMTSHPLDYLRSILFIPFYNARVHGIRPEIGQGWTLNYEMFFYLIFGPCLLLSRRLRLLPCVIVFSILAALGAAFHPAGPILSTYTDPLLFEFLFGMVIAYFLLQPVHRAWATAGVWLLFASACALVFLQLANPTLPLPRCIAVGVPAAALVATALWLELRGRIPTLAWVLLLGDASYSLYLSHTFVIALLRRLWITHANIHLVRTHALFILAVTLVAAPVSVFLYHHVERRSSRMVQALLTLATSLRNKSNQLHQTTEQYPAPTLPAL